jgi:hypothetical protein
VGIGRICRDRVGFNPGVELELDHQGFSGCHDKMIYGGRGLTPDVLILSRVPRPDALRCRSHRSACGTPGSSEWTGTLR